MKKIIGLIFAMTVFLTGCTTATVQTTAAPAPKAEPAKVEVKAEKAANSVRLNYHRNDGNYEGWGLHIWGDGYAGEAVQWTEPVAATGKTAYGVYWDIPYSGNGEVNFIIHNGDTKDPDGDRNYPEPDKNKEAWAVTEDPTAYTTAPSVK